MKTIFCKSVPVILGLSLFLSLPAFSQEPVGSGPSGLPPTAPTVVVGSGTIAFEKPPEKMDVDLMAGFKSRRPVEEHEGKETSLKDLVTVLWAGNGINREDGKRTAPAPKSHYLVQIYVLSDKGIYLYEPKGHSIRRISDKNVKDKVAKQPYLAQASHILALVVDPKLFTDEATLEKKIFWGGTTAGCIAENIYFAADALKLGTAIVESMNEEAVKEALQLKPDEIPVYLMPLGYPKGK